MRPIKAHELSHRGAMAQLMQRRAGVFHAQDNRSRLVQRLPRYPEQCEALIWQVSWGVFLLVTMLCPDKEK